MQLSAEVRWFWRGEISQDMKAWFNSKDQHGGAPGGGAVPRTDLYLRDVRQAEIGIKLRGNKPGYEIKGLVAELEPIDAAPFHGAGEIWSKWSIENLKFDARELIAIAKLRWMRKLSMDGDSPVDVNLGADESPLNPDERPRRGCQVELTQIFVGSHPWWSVSFEAFGGLASVEADLRTGVALMAKRGAVLPPGGTLASYPKWLSGCEKAD